MKAVISGIQRQQVAYLLLLAGYEFGRSLPDLAVELVHPKLVPITTKWQDFNTTVLEAPIAVPFEALRALASIGAPKGHVTLSTGWTGSTLALRQYLADLGEWDVKFALHRTDTQQPCHPIALP